MVFFMCCIAESASPIDLQMDMPAELSDTVPQFLGGREKGFEFQVYIIKDMQITVKLANKQDLS